MEPLREFKDKIDSLPFGDHTAGLKAVAAHVDIALKHRQRAMAGDLDLFTDVVYRCNQAFEGSIKEAYRVLSGKASGRKSTADMEAFLLANGALTERIVRGLTSYRVDWRNASAHNHMLEFTGDESLVAIQNVLTFSLVLCDKIHMALPKQKVEEPADVVTSTSLLERVAEATRIFSAGFAVPARGIGFLKALGECEEALAGHLGVSMAAWPGAIVHGPSEDPDDGSRDVHVRLGDELVVVEVRCAAQGMRVEDGLRSGMVAVTGSLAKAGVTGAVLAILKGSSPAYSISDAGETSWGRRVRVITAPEASES